MPSTQCSTGRWSGGQLLRRVIPLVGAMLASVALLGATASSAAAEPVGFFIAGEKSEEAAKQPKFTAEKYTATIASKALSGFEFVAQAGKLKCGELQLPGTITAATSELKFTQIFWPCTFIGLETTITWNGCQIALHVLNSGPPYTGTMDIVCPEGGGIEFKAHKEKGGPAVCNLTMSAQTGVTGVTYENTGTGSSRAVTVNLNLTGMKYTQTKETPFLPCVVGEYTNGVFTSSNSLFATK